MSNQEQWLVWCGLNAEQALMCRRLAEEGISFVSVEGGLSPEEKERRIETWTSGHVRVMVSKPSVLGFGMNFQHCHQMAFVGLSDSFEAYYQCIRRCYRFGQAHPVACWIVLADAEQEIYANILRKEEEATRMSEQLIRHVQSFEQAELAGTRQAEDYQVQTIKEEQYTLLLGDSCERLAELPEASIDLSIFSPPFQSLYTYSPTERDLGNSRTSEEFYQHFAYIIEQLLRVTKPGRNCCVHVSQLPTTLINDGYIGLKDFRGEMIAHFVRGGWIYHGEICIDKDPQVQAIRSHAKGLLFVQLRKDASWMRPAFADYILIFRKPGENAVPVHPDLTNEEWVQWARPIWYDIKESQTLNAAEGRERKDERHVCPLQLETIERCIRLWSNPGETVLSPFAGIGSEGYVALKWDRTFVGIELKASYFRTAHKNLERILSSKTQPMLLSLWEEHEAQPHEEVGA